MLSEFCQLLKTVSGLSIIDSNKVRHNLCLVQYRFDGEPHELHPRPHGNSKVKRPYTRSMKSLQEKLKQSSGKATLHWTESRICLTFDVM